MNKKVYAGIDLGGTTIKMGICSTDGAVIGETKHPTPKGPYQDVFRTFQQLLSDLLLQAGLSIHDVIGVGVGVPALLDVKKGYAFEIVNLGWRNVPIKFELERYLGVSCFVDNDANVAALGEMWQGAGRGAAHLICVTVGTGIGGGLILNGDIFHGAVGLAGEIGHLKVRPEIGRRCNCGNIGCLETEASATAIVFYGRTAVESGEATQLRQILDQSRGSLTARDVVDAAKNGDLVSIKIMERVSHYLGLALANLSNTLNPEKIVIGGGVSRAGSFFLNPIRDQFRTYALDQVARSVELLPAELGNTAGWLGAAWLVHRNLGEDGGN
ncbi:hypothetical protein BEP19_10145 [Ammoniphilus oxalaticus]|uniref:Glucokinase n=1 Tax=Ammoniphilus oxalaticus TaxID=66863 RepID=A0A419SFQ2_9BACL|nr:ROK family glucokinase [Ammoniphilus oxalaticus]RKD22612.1 hypothetical protein BEP19_10145 [Ammoniphilus oxalaticus]